MSDRIPTHQIIFVPNDNNIAKSTVIGYGYEDDYGRVIIERTYQPLIPGYECIVPIPVHDTLNILA